MRKIEDLSKEIYDVQVLDNYIRDNKIMTDEFYKYEGYFSIPEYLLYSDRIEVIKNGNCTVNELKDKMIKDLYTYTYIYKMPRIDMLDSEIKYLLLLIGESYKYLGKECYFINDMIKLNKLAIANSIVYDSETFNLKTYIRSMKYIESDHLSERDIYGIVNYVGKSLNFNAVELIKNDDGSYGCIGKNREIIVVDDDNFTSIEEAKRMASSLGYDENNVVELISHPEQLEVSKNDKVINLELYKVKKRIK